MKLQIVEYEINDLLNNLSYYKNVLLLDGRAVLEYNYPIRDTKVYNAVRNLLTLLMNIKDYDLEHYPKLNSLLTGLNNKTILYEQEVSDHFLKDIKIQQRIEEIEGDFVND